MQRPYGDDVWSTNEHCFNVIPTPVDDGFGRRRSGAMVMRESTAGLGGTSGQGAAPAPCRLVVGRPGQTRIHDIRNVQYMAGIFADQTGQVPKQVKALYLVRRIQLLYLPGDGLVTYRRLHNMPAYGSLSRRLFYSGVLKCYLIKLYSCPRYSSIILRPRFKIVILCLYSNYCHSKGTFY